MSAICKWMTLMLMVAVSAFAETRVLSWDFSIAPTKIDERRFPTGKGKNENVEYLLEIPAVQGDFVFSCRLSPLSVRAFSGFSVGVGQRGMTARQIKARFRLGDGNRSTCGIYQGSDYKEIAKPNSGVHLEECIVKMSWEASTSTLTYSAIGKSGTPLIPESQVQLKFNQFQPDCIIIGVLDAIGVGESHLVYDTKNERLTGLSFQSEKFQSTFALDDVTMEYK